MPRLSKCAEGLAGMTDIPRCDRRRTKHTALEEAKQLCEHLLNSTRSRLEEFEGAVKDTRIGEAHSLGLADIGFSHLDEASTARHEAQRSVDELARQRIEDDIHTVPVRGAQEVALEIQVT
jgi:hypothetical protein